MAHAHIMLEVEAGPMMRVGLDVLEFAVDLLEYIPDYCEADRDELGNRCQTLIDTLLATAERVEQQGECLSDGTT